MNLRFLLIDFICQTKLRPKGPKNLFWRPPPPPALSKSQYWLQDVNVRQIECIREALRSRFRCLRRAVTNFDFKSKLVNNITITGLGFSMMWRISGLLVLQKGAIIKCGNTKDWKDWSVPRPHYKSHSKHSKLCKELETRDRSRRIAPSSICITLQIFNLILNHTKAKRKLLVLYLWDTV